MWSHPIAECHPQQITGLDLCSYFLSSFSKPENGERARVVLIQKVKDALISIPEEEEVATETTVNENETWAQMSKRRKVERQEQVIHLP